MHEMCMAAAKVRKVIDIQKIFTLQEKLFLHMTLIKILYQL
jgi:hypothetical protein